MTVENRTLTAGERFVARYKKVAYTVAYDPAPATGEPVGQQVFIGVEPDSIKDHRFTTLSAAGKQITNGSCNGWRFFSREGDAPEPKERAEKPKHRTTAKGAVQIRKLPNQKGAPEGQTKWFCSSCMASFAAPDGTTPEACPEGHPRVSEDELAPSH